MMNASHPRAIMRATLPISVHAREGLRALRARGTYEFYISDIYIYIYIYIYMYVYIYQLILEHVKYLKIACK